MHRTPADCDPSRVNRRKNGALGKGAIVPDAPKRGLAAEAQLCTCLRDYC